jgi:hypothetical protein
LSPLHTSTGMAFALTWNNEVWNGTGGDGKRFIQVCV